VHSAGAPLAACSSYWDAETGCLHHPICGNWGDLVCVLAELVVMLVLGHGASDHEGAPRMKAHDRAVATRDQKIDAPIAI